MEIKTTKGDRLNRKSTLTNSSLLAICACALWLAGCDASNKEIKPDQGVATPASGSPPAEVRTAATLAMWTAAVRQTFDSVDGKRLRDKKNPTYLEHEGTSDSNGVKEFFACFDKAPPKCDLSAMGKRDGFRKIQFFNDPKLDWLDLAAKYSDKTSVSAYVSLRDCHMPSILLQPTFRAASWLFVEQFGIMVDGVVVVERKFDGQQVNRENSHKEVSESTVLILTQQEIDALRKAQQAQQVLIRITGQKGYVGVDQESTKGFLDGVSRLIRIHDSLAGSVSGIVPVKDEACPT